MRQSVCFIELLSPLPSSTGRKPPGSSEPKRVSTLGLSRDPVMIHTCISLSSSHPLALSSSFPLPLSLPSSLSLPRQFYSDDCNTCMCAKQSNGEAVITCTKKVCGCQDPTQPGKIFKSGEKWQKEGNCVTCECLPSFNVNCVKTCNTKTGRR